MTFNSGELFTAEEVNTLKEELVIFLRKNYNGRELQQVLVILVQRYPVIILPEFAALIGPNNWVS